jgi:hypothetical protein
MSKNDFLAVTKVQSEEAAIRNAIQAALQRNKVYSSDSEEVRRAFRVQLAKFLRAEAQRYVKEVSEEEHCAAIRHIACIVSNACAPVLQKGRFRFGTAQKAFNLYLKFLWKLGKIEKPPHCPIDGIVLSAAGILGSWTKSDSECEYLRWVGQLRVKAKSLSLAEWEDGVWLEATAGGKP